MRSAWSSWSLPFAGVIVVATFAASACGGSDGSSNFPDNGADDAGVDGGVAPPLATNEGGPFGEGGPPQGVLIVSPADTTLDVTTPGPAATRQFTATAQGSTIALHASWSVDLPLVGVIDGNGLFTASGKRGGRVTIGAQTASGRGATTLTVSVHVVDDPGGLPPGTQGQLDGGGAADTKFRWLYPYDATVFPRGLTPPTLQWDGEVATAMKVHVKSSTIDYVAYYAASSPPRIDLSATAWSLITESAASGDPVTVEATKLSAKGVTGPIKETWSIAQGSLKGTVYYNTYDSPLNKGLGAVMRVKPGKDAEVLLGGCRVCHAVSADGSTMIAMGDLSDPSPDAGLPGDDPYFYQLGASYDLTNNASKLHDEKDSAFAFGALSPDGSKMLSCGSMAGDAPPNVPGLGNVGRPSGDRPSKLYDPKTGAVIPAPGFDGVVKHALMPAFSPDGARVVFNHFDVGAGHTLSVMDFAKGTNTFSGLTVVADATAGSGIFLGWPYFTPDSKVVVYNTVDYGDYATWDRYKQIPAHHGDLFAVDVAGKTVTAFDGANGILNGNPYLPYGAAEAHLNYEPTILPVAVGGYYWVVFTSRREYGNTLTDADPFEAHPAKRKKLWVSAIDINLQPGKDPSHPAFYLPGQELAAGNMRAFWALDPCQQNGTSCDSGDQCCSGFCRQSTTADGGAVLSCVPQPVGCAQEFEKCDVAADCCGAPQGYECINGHCARPPIK